jgi:hypothetical protein
MDVYWQTTGVTSHIQYLYGTQVINLTTPDHLDGRLHLLLCQYFTHLGSLVQTLFHIRFSCRHSGLRN